MKYNFVHEITENRSRFVTYVITDFKEIDSVKNIYNELKKEHKKARHVCWAYSSVIDGITYERYNDDGEPKGTAGIPILSTIKNKGKQDILILVVRYFGGSKLGASKLLRTYRRAAKESIDLLEE